MTSPARRPTYDRWERAIARAIAEGIRVVRIADDVAYVTSSDGRGCYRTDGTRCTCAAGQGGDTCCKHNAAYYLFHERMAGRPAAA